MLTEEKLLLINEGMDSYKLLCEFIGQLDSSANLVLLKWPDATKALAQEDFKTFKEDMRELIYKPIFIIGVSLIDLAESNKIDCGKYRSLLINLQMANDPIESKKEAILIINKVIETLSENGSRRFRLIGVKK